MLLFHSNIDLFKQYKSIKSCEYTIICENMANITLSIPEELKKKLEQFPEYNWSALIKKFLENKISKLSLKEELLNNLEEDSEALELGRSIKEAMWKKYKKEGW